MTSNFQSKDNGVLSDKKLNSVSGGATFHYPIRSNGDNPFVQAVQLAEKKALFEGSWCSQPDHA
jgi:bacteriocin-like protein